MRKNQKNCGADTSESTFRKSWWTAWRQLHYKTAHVPSQAQEQLHHQYRHRYSGRRTLAASAMKPMEK